MIARGAVQCRRAQGWLVGGWYQKCKQFLSIVDSNTGEVITAVEGEADSDEEEFAPSWEETVEKLNDAYPKNFKPMQASERIEKYKELSKEESQRQRERFPAHHGE